MKKIILQIAIAACALAPQFAPATPPPDVKEIMSKPLTDFPGKEGLVLTVTYPPGGADEIHRHNAHAFVYVLEGSVVMQLRGAEPVTLKAGEGFYEGPNDVHIVGRNASDSQPAKFVSLTHNLPDSFALSGYPVYLADSQSARFSLDRECVVRKTRRRRNDG
jgi:quercetin dioxygenase-like cupin family protein